MMSVSCEDFEREFADFSGGRVTEDRRKDLEEHRRNCDHCRRYAEESEEIREALQRIPKLEVPPYFATNLKREINRMELGLKRLEWSPSPAPRFLALSTGFAMALIVGFIFLQPGKRQWDYPTLPQPLSGTGDIADAENTEVDTDMTGRSLMSNPSDIWFAAEGSVIDTARHRLPEPAGTDSIPIPMDDDYPRINQVSTTPGEP